ncbi:MAG: hypothetical protein JW801_16040 [Bacteroidales bacterium]|nr:hypothetical protein [Bacteroidales bacterium]
MKFIENTKRLLGERAIRQQQKMQKRKLASCNIQNAKTIGILFNATHAVAFDIVKDLVKDMEVYKANILALGFVDSKQLIDHYLYRKGFDFFTRNELNWYGKPTSENVQAFIKKPFDILLDLSLDNPFPVKYIVACSSAKFKAGRYQPEQEYLDFMIDMEKENAAMTDIHKELAKDQLGARGKNKELEKIVNKKIQTEIQMNFLIRQLVHYLSKIK